MLFFMEFFFYKIWFTRVENSYDINIDFKTVEFLFYFNFEIHNLRKILVKNCTFYKTRDLQRNLISADTLIHQCKL